MCVPRRINVKRPSVPIAFSDAVRLDGFWNTFVEDSAEMKVEDAPVTPGCSSRNSPRLVFSGSDTTLLCCVSRVGGKRHVVFFHVSLSIFLPLCLHSRHHARKNFSDLLLLRCFSQPPLRRSTKPGARVAVTPFPGTHVSKPSRFKHVP